MSEIGSLHDLLRDELRDLYDAEERQAKAIARMAKKATGKDLRAALEAHLAQTETHVERLEHAFDLVDEKAKAITCAGMKGIIEEARGHMSEDFDTDELLDLVIVGAAMRMEHYEIAAYTSTITLANQLDLADVVELLEDTLAEEKAAAEKLIQMGAAVSAAAMAASHSADEDDDETDDEEEEEEEDDEDEAEGK